MRTPKRKLLLAVAVLVCAVLAGEGGHRAWLFARGRPYDAAATRSHILRIRSAVADPVPLPGEVEPARKAPPASRSEFLHPYLGFDSKNHAGQLERDLERSARDDEYEIVLLGGSVANIFCAQGGPRLTELLAADPRFSGREVRLLNYARAAHKQPQQANMLTWLVALGLRPEAVINLDGFNEVAVANANRERGAHPAYPAFGQWLAQALAGDADLSGFELHERLLAQRERIVRMADRALRLRLYQSSILGGWSLARLRADDRLRFEQSREYERHLEQRAKHTSLLGPAFEGGVDQGLAFSVADWSRSSRTLAGICAAHGIYYLHALQPTLHDPGAKPISAQELELGAAIPAWTEGARRGYPLLRAAGAELARDGLRFVDCSRVFAQVEEPLYYDACHFVKRGNVLLAEAIARAFLTGMG